jgi:hypothetical protein
MLVFRVMLPIPLELSLALLLGTIFAAAARSQFKAGQSPWGRELYAVLLFEGIIAWPVAIYFLLVHPDWSWLYLVDPNRLSWAISALVLVAHAVLLVGGYLAGYALVHGRRERELGIAMAVFAGAVLIATVLCRGRVLASGTFAEYHAGYAASMFERKLVWSLGATGLAVVTAAVIVGVAVWEHGKRYREA